MSWFEELPKSCPPVDAQTSSGISFYRVLDSAKAEDQDFLSYRKLNPDKKFPLDECQVRAVSVYSEISECENLFKFPKFRNKEKHIGEIVLEPIDGVIKNTPNKNSTKHFSWWRSVNFSIDKVKCIR